MEGLNATPLVKRAVHSENSQVPYQSTGLDDSQKDVAWEPQSQGCRWGEETSQTLSAHGTSVPVRVGWVGEMPVPSLSLNLGDLKQVTHPAWSFRSETQRPSEHYQSSARNRKDLQRAQRCLQQSPICPARQAQDRLPEIQPSWAETPNLTTAVKRWSLEPDSQGSNPTTAVYQLSDLQFPHLWCNKQESFHYVMKIPHLNGGKFSINVSWPLITTPTPPGRSLFLSLPPAAKPETTSTSLRSGNCRSLSTVRPLT